MSIAPFPERVSARKLCNRNESINSTIALGKLLRLSEYLYDNDGQAEVSLHFDRDQAGHCYISGKVASEVKMQCQRCLEATAISVSSDFVVKIAETDKEVEQITGSSAEPLDKLEVILCEAGELNLFSLIEDELIMCLPIVVSHDDTQCSDKLNALQRQTLEARVSDKPRGSIKGLDTLETLRKALKEDNDTE